MAISTLLKSGLRGGRGDRAERHAGSERAARHRSPGADRQESHRGILAQAQGLSRVAGSAVAFLPQGGCSSRRVLRSRLTPAACRDAYRFCLILRRTARSGSRPGRSDDEYAVEERGILDRGRHGRRRAGRASRLGWPRWGSRWDSSSASSAATSPGADAPFASARRACRGAPPFPIPIGHGRQEGISAARRSRRLGGASCGSPRRNCAA